MKNKVVLIILALAIVLILFFSIFGLKIGKIEIMSISKIVEKNKEINNQIDKVSQLTSVDYPKSVSTLETTVNNLKTQKEKYEEISDLGEGDEGIIETEKYDITYLWTTLGKLAPKYKVKMAMNVKKTSGTELYDLEFNITGEYVQISSFIKRLEDDSELKFRIYNFKLMPGSGDELNATFTVKNVMIDEKTLIKNSGSNSNSNVNQKNNTNNKSESSDAQKSNNSNTVDTNNTNQAETASNITNQ